MRNMKIVNQCDHSNATLKQIKQISIYLNKPASTGIFNEINIFCSRQSIPCIRKYASIIKKEKKTIRRKTTRYTGPRAALWDATFVIICVVRNSRVENEYVNKA